MNSALSYMQSRAVQGRLQTDMPACACLEVLKCRAGSTWDGGTKAALGGRGSLAVCQPQEVCISVQALSFGNEESD